MLKNVEKLLNLMVLDFRMMVLDFFQTTNLVFGSFYRSRQVLRSVVHRKTIFCIDFVLILMDFW